MLAVAHEGSLLAVPWAPRDPAPRRPSSGPWHCRVPAQAHVDSTRLCRMGSQCPRQPRPPGAGPYHARPRVPHGDPNTADVKVKFVLTTFLVAQRVKNLPAMQETRVRSLGQEDPWRRKWQPTPVRLPGESQGQGSLAGYSLWGCKESDTTERLTHKNIPIVLRPFGASLAAAALPPFPSLIHQEAAQMSHHQGPSPALRSLADTKKPRVSYKWPESESLSGEIVR